MAKIVFITGATSGIGFATAEMMLEKGYTVWAVGRREERLRQLRDRFPRSCVTGFMDVTDTKSVDEFFSKHDPSQIDILINNAGLAVGTEKAFEAPFEDWNQMLQTNVTGVLYVSSKVLPFLARKPGSHVVNLGSVAGKWVYPGGAVYCATKSAVRAFSEGLRMDLMGRKVKVTNIEPGMVETEFSLVRLKNPELAERVYAGMEPLRAQDIAESILWCLERPAHVNISELTLFPVDQAGVGPHLVARS